MPHSKNEDLVDPGDHFKSKKQKSVSSSSSSSSSLEKTNSKTKSASHSSGQPSSNSSTGSGFSSNSSGQTTSTNSSGVGGGNKTPSAKNVSESSTDGLKFNFKPKVDVATNLFGTSFDELQSPLRTKVSGSNANGLGALSRINIGISRNEVIVEAFSAENFSLTMSAISEKRESVRNAAFNQPFAIISDSIGRRDYGALR